MDRKGVVPLERISLQRSLKKIGQYLRVLCIWPSLHFEHFDMMEGISGPIVLPKIKWTVGWQSDSRKIVEGIIDQSILWFGEVLDGML